MADIYFDIPLRLPNTEYKYGDFVAANEVYPTPYAAVLADIRLSLAALCAFVDFNAAGTLTPYLGSKIEIIDSAGKKATGYIKNVGTEELGSELITGWTNYGSGFDYETLTVSSNRHDITSAINSTGGAEADAGPITVNAGKTYEITINISLNSGAAPGFGVSDTKGTSNILQISSLPTGIYTYEVVASSNILWLYFSNGAAANWAATVSLKEKLNYGSELVTNGEFNTDTNNWTPSYCTIASIAGGIGGKCCEITRTSYGQQQVSQAIGNIPLGTLVEASIYAKSGTSGNENALLQLYNGYAPYGYNETATTSSWTKRAFLFNIHTNPNGWNVHFYKRTATSGTMLFDKVSLKKIVAPSETGVTIVSTPGGSIQSWGSIDAGFNYNDPAGYTCQIYRSGHIYMCSTPGISAATPPDLDRSPGSLSTDGGVVWTQCTPPGMRYFYPCAFDANPRYGDYQRGKKYFQPMDRADGGDLYVYDKCLDAENTRSISWEKILPADLTRLLEFIEMVRGAAYPFNFYDENGTIHQVRITNPNEIKSAPVSHNFEGGITVELLFVNEPEATETEEEYYADGSCWADGTAYAG